MNSEIKVVKISELTPFEKNTQKHTQDQINDLAKSIETYGQYQVIVTDENMKVLCGHGKLMALKQLGREEAEIKVIYGLTDKQKKKLVISDNKIQSKSLTDFKAVDELIKEIGETDIIGFDDNYIESLLKECNVDNMGVDLTAPITIITPEEKPTEEQTKVEQKQKEEIDDFESGIGEKSETYEEDYNAYIEKKEAEQNDQPQQSTPPQITHNQRAITCPHCGKTIVINI